MPLPGFLQNLTNEGVVDPQTGQVRFYPDAAHAAKALATAQSQQVQPSTSDITANGVTQNQPQNPLSKIIKPTFQQAQQPLGGDLTNPALSKGGKLISFLLRAGQGALAGRAASEQALAQSGGHVAGGAGMGFQAAQTAALQRAEMPLQYQQAQTQTQLGQAGLQPVQTQYGTLPAEMAVKSFLPALIRGQYGLQGKQIEAGAQIQGKQIQGQTARDVANINQGMAIPLDPTVAHMAGMDELAHVPVGRGTLTNINKAIEAKGYRIQDMGKNGEDENSGMWLMDRAGTRLKQISPNSLTFQRGASFAQNRPEVVTDPNDPGYAYYTSAAEAMNKKLPSPMGAGTQAAKAAARSEVPTKIGDQKVAFNTAMQHADLLSNAAQAIQNGNQQTLNSLKNRFANEFGQAGPITAQSIADAYAREVTKMLSGHHLTDSEIGTIGSTINPTRQSPEQIQAVLKAYKALAQSKLNMLNQQKQSATAPRKPNGNATSNPKSADPFGIR